VRTELDLDLETAVAPCDGRARLYGPSGARPLVTAIMARQARMIKAGAYQCADCRQRPGNIPMGTPWDLRSVCATCATAARLKSREQRQHETLAAMRRRGAK
jgi:hypothetical protein